MDKYGVCVKCSGSGHYMEKNASGNNISKRCSVCYPLKKKKDKSKNDKGKKNDS